MFFAAAVAAEPLISHDITLSLQPDKQLLDADDIIELENPQRDMLSVSLNAKLQLSSNDKNIVEIKLIKQFAAPTQDEAAVNTYSIKFRQPLKQFHLHFTGGLDALHAPTDTAASNSANGISLSSAEHWFPAFYHNELLRFSVRVTMPQKWYSVSQGQRSERQIKDGMVTEVWKETLPQPDIYLIAAPFYEYRKSEGGVNASVYLRSEDAELAGKFLDASVRYINFYQKFIAPYPYSKFATVENSWDSGYGMPSFTLLGPKVLRFPFILNTSFPHEILHNWWGNSVYVDFDSGNWSEGLTQYLADHLIKEQSGEARQYRLDMLQKYHDYVDQAGDFSIADFQMRSDERSQSVGYHKTGMMFHMLRLQLGDKQFIEALRYFYQKQQFKISSFKDLQQCFSEKSEIDLSRFFSQWVDRVGAPELKVEQVDSRKTGDSYLLTLTLQQLQDDAPYQLQVPLWIWSDNDKAPLEETLSLNQKQQSFRFNLKHAPIRVEVDPRYDVFRRLDSGEIPAALSQGFGANPTYIIVAKKAEKSLYDAYQQLALQWKALIANAQIVDDEQLENVPDKANVWIMGWENRFRHRISDSETGLTINTWPDKMQLGDSSYKKGEAAVVIAGRRKNDRQYTLLWLASNSSASITALARKLPHYSIYSYLVFDDAEVKNLVKGKWILQNTPMKFALSANHAHYASVPARAPLFSLDLPLGQKKAGR